MSSHPRSMSRQPCLPGQDRRRRTCRRRHKGACHRWWGCWTRIHDGRCFHPSNSIQATWRQIPYARSTCHRPAPGTAPAFSTPTGHPGWEPARNPCRKSGRSCLPAQSDWPCPAREASSATPRSASRTKRPATRFPCSWPILRCHETRSRRQPWCWELQGQTSMRPTTGAGSFGASVAWSSPGRFSPDDDRECLKNSPGVQSAR